jgi:type VI secretion system protein
LSERSLLERLRRPDVAAQRRGEDSLQDMADSILRHLQRMLNTRQGNAPTVPDYGVPDLTELARGFPASSSTLEESIRACVEKYEPRLREVTVRYKESPDDVLSLSFEVTGRLVVHGEEAGVWFLTKIDPEGRVDVKG